MADSYNANDDALRREDWVAPSLFAVQAGSIRFSLCEVVSHKHKYTHTHTHTNYIVMIRKTINRKSKTIDLLVL
jgi:hypothetical protein